jgi:hypothetical protein
MVQGFSGTPRIAAMISSFVGLLGRIGVWSAGGFLDFGVGGEELSESESSDSWSMFGLTFLVIEGCVVYIWGFLLTSSKLDSFFFSMQSIKYIGHFHGERA